MGLHEELYLGCSIVEWKWENKEEDESSAPGGIWTHDSLIRKRAIYHRATAAAFLAKIIIFELFLQQIKWNPFFSI